MLQVSDQLYIEGLGPPQVNEQIDYMLLVIISSACVVFAAVNHNGVLPIVVRM